MKTNDSSPVSQCPIILVHGTWGRGLFAGAPEQAPRGESGERWFEPGSTFYKALQTALEGEPEDYSIAAFHWSGRNSVFARDVAARELAARLERAVEDPGAAPIIIAHSHGGNIALRAFQHLTSDPARVRLITLATPFLRVFAREQVNPSFTVLLLIWGAIFGVSFTAIVAILLFVAAAIGFPSSSNVTFALLLMAMVVCAVFSAVLVYRLVALFMKVGGGTQDLQNRATALQKATFYPSVDENGARMLVIRGVDDEASLSLAAGSIGSRLSSLLLLSIIPNLYLVGLVLIFLLVHLSLLGDQ